MATTFFRFFVLFLGASGLAFSQPISFASSDSKVSTEILLDSETIPAGTDARVAIVLSIEESWHINSHQPTYDYLIGTSLAIEPAEGIIVSDLRYPSGNDVRFEFADDALNVYDGSVTIFLSLRISDKLAAGGYKVAGTLRVQACNDQVCLAPSNIAIEIPLPVTAADASPQDRHSEVFAAYIATPPTADGVENSLAEMFEAEGSLVTFFAIFLVGLALNLTPCVYPMLSVTVSLFGTQTDTQPSRVFLKALVYVMGIATMFSVLGVTVALSGGLFGSWLQSPWVSAGIGGLLFALALSMFGLYQLQAPYWLTSKLGGTTGTGFVSLFVSGLVVGIFAAPCISPPVITLLALVGQKGDPFFGFWAFFVLSVGLGFPYLILGTFSGLLKKVPRSGAWLVWVERIFGVVLTGAALFYLSLAFVPNLAAYVVPLTFAAGGVYLGFFERSSQDKPVLRRVKWIFGIASIVAGGYFANALREPGVSWEPYTDARIAEARAANNPVMIDFYADWCIPCLELDRKTFTDPGIMEASERFTRLKVDLTHFDSPEAETIRKAYDIAGVPTIVFLQDNGEEERGSRVIGYLPPDEFLQRMKPLME